MIFYYLFYGLTLIKDIKIPAFLIGENLIESNIKMSVLYSVL
jgi:hypothetical protein